MGTQGYQTFENTEIKAAIDRRCVRRMRDGFGMRVLHPDCDIGMLREELRNLVPQDTKWLFKTGIDSWNIWDGLFEDAQHVFVKRPIKSVVSSSHNKSSRKAKDIHSMVVQHYEMIDRLSEERHIPIVMADQVVKGDFATLDNAFAHLGEAFYPALAKKRIEPRRWRH